MKKIAIISPDTISLPLTPNCPPLLTQYGKEVSTYDKCVKATALGNRAQNIAEQLSHHFSVTIFVPELNYPGDIYIQKITKYEITSYDYSKNIEGRYSDVFLKRLEAFDIVMIQTTSGAGFAAVSKLRRSIYVILDAWVPLLVEYPAAISYRDDLDRNKCWDDFLLTYQRLFNRANLILYANERQKYFYEGILFYSSKQNWEDLERSVLLKVPYGFESHECVKRKSNKDEKLRLLWYGAFYPWYDPCYLTEVVKNNPGIELTFFGAQHPRYRNYFLALSKEFDFTGSNIKLVQEYSLNDPVDLFSNFDACIMIARNWVEDKYSHRVRTLEVVNRGMPLILSHGNSLLEEYPFLSSHVIPVHNKELATELEAVRLNKDLIFNKQKITDSLALLHKNYSWAKVVELLTKHIQSL